MYAFLDATQVTKGHTLIVPKKHFRNIFEMTGDELATVTAKIPELANLIKDKMHADGMNIMSNLEAAAGQSVFHTHIHLVPRYKGDTGVEETFFREKPMADPALLEGIQKEILG